MSPTPSIASQILGRVTGLVAELVGAPPAPTGELVLILPGFGASELAARGRKLWFDLEATREGRLVELAYDPEAPPFDPVDTFNLVYGQLKLRLELRGHEVAFHPFDWRRPFDELGSELARFVAMAGRKVHLVGHSMGALVARAATLQGAADLGKVILLGPPNQGTFTVVQGIRGTHWVLHLLSIVSGKNSPDELATEAFATWPSVYPQLPAGGTIDLLDPDNWPEGLRRPRRDLLEAAHGVQEWLAGSRGDIAVIGGYGVPTVVGVERSASGFDYLHTDGGDGWIPTGRVVLGDHPCYFTACEHLTMANDQRVIAAVLALVEGGTPELPRQPPEARELGRSSDDTAPPVPFGGRSGAEVTHEDILEALATTLTGSRLL